MKKVLSTVLVLLFSVSLIAQTPMWEAKTSGTTADLHGIDIVNKSVIWVCSGTAAGTVIKSVDGGNTWVAAGSVGQEAWSIAAWDANTAVVITGPSSGNGKISRTTDGGATWTTVYTTTGAWFNFVETLEGDKAWAQSDPVGGSFLILKTSDKGATWAPVANPPAQLNSDAGCNSGFDRIGNTCWFGTSNSSTSYKRIYKSTNGPDGPWTAYNTTKNNVGVLAFKDVNTGLCAYWSTTTKISKTTDGCATFTDITTTMGTPNGMDYIVGYPYVWAATTTGIFHSTNDGGAWVQDVVPAGVTAMNNVLFYNDCDFGFAVGPGGTILKSLLPPVTPVELTSFTADFNDSKASIEWKTVTETNNQGFELQRKIDNQQWEKVAFIKGNGTTTTPVVYRYSDDLFGVNASSVVYRLRQIDFDGKENFSHEVSLGSLAPSRFVLAQNYPNPFNPATIINYQLAKEGQTSLKVYNSLGQEIAVLAEGFMSAGTYKAQFNASALSAGVYYYVLKSGEFTETRKMMLIK